MLICEIIPVESPKLDPTPSYYQDTLLPIEPRSEPHCVRHCSQFPNLGFDPEIKLKKRGNVEEASNNARQKKIKKTQKNGVVNGRDKKKCPALTRGHITTCHNAVRPILCNKSIASCACILAQGQQLLIQ